jgi:hypothetical protein
MLIRDPVIDQHETGNAAPGSHSDQGLFHRRVAERVPLLQEMDPQHGGQQAPARALTPPSPNETSAVWPTSWPW